MNCACLWLLGKRALGNKLMHVKWLEHCIYVILSCKTRKWEDKLIIPCLVLMMIIIWMYLCPVKYRQSGNGVFELRGIWFKEMTAWITCCTKPATEADFISIIFRNENHSWHEFIEYQGLMHGFYATIFQPTPIITLYNIIWYCTVPQQIKRGIYKKLDPPPHISSSWVSYTSPYGVLGQ